MLHLLYHAIKRRLATKSSLRQIKYAVQAGSLKMMIGAGGKKEPGWISTEENIFNLLKPEKWAQLIHPNSIDAIMAEHVWEHLSESDGICAAKTCYQFLKPKGRIRIAVPDGFHPDPKYIRYVEPGGYGPGSDDHKVLYTYKALQKVFEDAGFKVIHLEHFDENGQFYSQPWLESDGKIERSKRFDSRNENGKLNYTSIIIDAIKPA